MVISKRKPTKRKQIGKETSTNEHTEAKKIKLMDAIKNMTQKPNADYMNEKKKLIMKEKKE